MTVESIPLEGVRLTHVRVPLHEPFAISNGTVSEKDAILIELLAQGAGGLGEASPMAGSFYSHHTPESTWTALTRRLIPRMDEAGELDLEGQWFADAVDNPFATCGVDTALWDLAARRRGVPLATLLGGNTSRSIESGLAVGLYASVDELLERIDRYRRADGYRRVKIKVQPGWDEEPLEAIRIRFGRIPLMVDANGAYGREHIAHIAAWDRFGLMMIEQPLGRLDLEGHAELSARCRTPICLDEGAESPPVVERAIELRAARIINIKLQRVGGLAAALRIHDLAAQAGIGCWMGTMPELGVGATAAIHFATLPNIVYPSDVEASGRWFTADVIDPPVTCFDGLLTLPAAPGLGVRLDPTIVQRYKVREWSMPLACRLSVSLQPREA